MLLGSTYSQSPTRQGVLTPDLKLQDEPPQRATEIDRPTDIHDDLALGFGLMQRKFGRLSLQQGLSAYSAGSGRRPFSETLPDRAGRRLHSEICTVFVGPSQVVFHAHREVLAQSPVFAALLEHRSRCNQTLQLNLRDQDPTAFRRVLQYLYGQTLPVTAVDGNEQVRELVDGYIMACRLEMEELQSLMIRALERNEGGATTSQVLSAAGLVYQADEARPAFDKFFVSTVDRGIERQGFAGPEGVGEVISSLIVQGGMVARNIGEAFQQVYARGKKNESQKSDMEIELQKANRRIEELEDQVEGLETETTSTSNWSLRLKSSPTWAYSRGTAGHSKHKENRTKFFKDQ